MPVETIQMTIEQRKAEGLTMLKTPGQRAQEGWRRYYAVRFFIEGPEGRVVKHVTPSTHPRSCAVWPRLRRGGHCLYDRRTLALLVASHFDEAHDARLVTVWIRPKPKTFKEGDAVMVRGTVASTSRTTVTIDVGPGREAGTRDHAHVYAHNCRAVQPVRAK